MHRVQSHDVEEVRSLPEAEGLRALEVRLFGRLQLSNGDKATTSFPSRKSEELLAFLLLHNGVPQARDRLIELLWPGVSPDVGRSRLSTALWRVRLILDDVGLIPNHYLEASTDTIAISLDPQGFLDYRLFQEHIGAAKAVPPGEVMESHLQSAESLCSGELLEGIYAEWCLIERERAARLRLYGLGQLVAFYLSREAYHDAIEICQKILELDPLREEVYRTLMVCYSEVGRRSDGIRQFQRCANMLLDELGILPMTETIEVYRRLVAQAADFDLVNGIETEHERQLMQTFEEFMALGDRLISLIEN